MTVAELRQACPDCGEGEIVPLGVLVGSRCPSCGWEGSSFMEPTHGPKFDVRWYENDPENVGLIFAVLPDGEHKIAELFWNGGEWLFIPQDKDGDVVNGSEHWKFIDADPDMRLHLNAVATENNALRLDRPDAVNEALDAALATMRLKFRDDTREMAVVGAKIFARGWYSHWTAL